MHTICRVSIRLALCTLALCTTGPAGAADHESRGQKGYGGLTPRPPNAEAATQMRRFQARYGGTILWSRDTGLPARVSLLRVPLAQSLTVGTVDWALRQFMTANRPLLGVDPAHLARRAIVPRGRRLLVQYQQTHDGVPVGDASIGCIASTDGQLLHLAGSYDPRVEVSTQGLLDQAAAEKTGREALGQGGKEAALGGCERLIHRVRGEVPARWRMVYRLSFTSAAIDRMGDFMVVVDAQTGEVLAVGPSAPGGIHGQVQAKVWPDRSSDLPETRALSHVTVSAVGSAGHKQSTLTGQDGAYSLQAGRGNWRIEAELNGPYARVVSRSSKAVRHGAATADGARHNWQWQGDPEQINVFYHINRIHTELYQRVMGYNWINSWTGTQQFAAVTGYAFPNAYPGHPMKFGAGGPARNADSVYHECTHNVLHALFGGRFIGYSTGVPDEVHSEAYAMDEGFADFFAAVLLQRPDVNGRNCSNASSYPGLYDSATGLGPHGHRGGKLIAGVAWDLRALMQRTRGEEAGARLNANLIFDALATMATLPRPYRFSHPSQSNFMEALRLADDDNRNMDDGTPNDRMILQAFRAHRMLPVDVYVRDGLADEGHVAPTEGFSIRWASPDIVVGPARGPMGMSPFAGPDNTEAKVVRVLVRNGGYMPTGSVSVALYSADLAQGTTWPDDWARIGQADLSSIPPGKSAWTEPVRWRRPKTGAPVLMARLACAGDPMTEPDAPLLENNVALHSVVDLSAKPGETVRTPSRLSPVLAPAAQPPPARVVVILRERLPEQVEMTVQQTDPDTGKPVMPACKLTQVLAGMRPTGLADKLKSSPSIRREAQQGFAELDQVFGAGPRKQSDDQDAAPPPPKQFRAECCRLPLGPARLCISFRVPADAEPGHIYVFHVGELHGRQIAAGASFRVQVTR